MLQNLMSNRDVFEVFNYKNLGQVRTSINLDTKETLFCLSDVCDVLGITNNRNVVSRLSENGIHTLETVTNGGTQSLTFISLSNVFKVIFTSRKPEAEAFADWLTDEVLPSIANRGYYVMGELSPMKVFGLLLKQIIDNSTGISKLFGMQNEYESDIKFLKLEIESLKDILKRNSII